MRVFKSSMVILTSLLLPVMAVAGASIPALDYQPQSLRIQDRTYTVQVPGGYRLELRRSTGHA